MQGDLLVDQQLGHCERDLATLTDEGAPSPGPGVLQGDHAGGELPERSMLASQPRPPVRSWIVAVACASAGTAWSTSPMLLAISSRSGATSVAMMGPAPSARPSMAAASPTGPSPVISGRS